MPRKGVVGNPPRNATKAEDGRFRPRLPCHARASNPRGASFEGRCLWPVPDERRGPAAPAMARTAFAPGALTGFSRQFKATCVIQPGSRCGALPGRCWRSCTWRKRRARGVGPICSSAVQVSCLRRWHSTRQSATGYGTRICMDGSAAPSGLVTEWPATSIPSCVVRCSCLGRLLGEAGELTWRAGPQALGSRQGSPLHSLAGTKIRCLTNGSEGLNFSVTSVAPALNPACRSQGPQSNQENHHDNET